MARAREQFRQKDVTFWGLAALGCAAFALLAGNLSGLLPEPVVTALHSPRQAAVTTSERIRQMYMHLGDKLGPALAQVLPGLIDDILKRR